MRSWKRLEIWKSAWKSHRNWTEIKGRDSQSVLWVATLFNGFGTGKKCQEMPRKQLLSAPEIISIGPLPPGGGSGSPNGAARAEDATADGEQRQLQGLMGGAHHGLQLNLIIGSGWDGIRVNRNGGARWRGTHRRPHTVPPPFSRLKIQIFNMNGFL